MNPDHAHQVRHGLARVFCVIGSHESPITDEKLIDIDLALASHPAYEGATESERRTILNDAFATIQREGENGIGDACEHIREGFGPATLEMLISLVLSWGTRLPAKEQLLWHLNTDLGVSMDGYHRMWERAAASTARNIPRPAVPQLPPALPPPLPESALGTVSTSGRLQAEVRLLDQYEEELLQLISTLASADVQSSKHIQARIDQRKQIYWRQIALVQAQWPDAPAGKMHEAGYCAAEAQTLILSNGLMRRMSERSSNMAVKIATGVVAKGQEAGNRTKALEMIGRALSIVDHPYAHYVKACILLDMGDRSGAVAILNYIITRFADDEGIYLQARSLKEEIENPPKNGCAGCFVATAAYGSPLAHEVVLLSRFRDQVLLPTWAGARFVTFYYRISPPLAATISRSAFLRAVTRNLLLRPVLTLLHFSGFTASTKAGEL